MHGRLDNRRADAGTDAGKACLTLATASAGAERKEGKSGEAGDAQKRAGCQEALMAKQANYEGQACVRAWFGRPGPTSLGKACAVLKESGTV